MPATYQKKYYTQFTSLDGKVNVVELWWLTATTPTAEEVKTTALPFTVEMPELSHKFQVVRGTGCELNLLSPTDRKFFTGLYHTSMKEYMIKHYIDSTINWLGYLNSELVRESYSEFVNYPFQITGNDGFALLDRLQFLTIAGAVYTGMKSMFELISIALLRIGLPFSDLYISLSTTFSDFTAGADVTILHEQYVDSANFYNEDGEAETMRKVIEACLQPFAGVITQIRGDIYITDVNLLGVGSSITYKKYDLTTGVYSEDVVIDPIKDLSDIGYMGTGSEIERSGGKNKQVVSYSPYPKKTLLPETLKELSEISGSVPLNFSIDTDYFVWYKTLTGHLLLNCFSPASFQLSYSYSPPEDIKEASVCLAWAGDGSASHVVLSLIVNPLITITDAIEKYNAYTKTNRGIKIKISGELRLRVDNYTNQKQNYAAISLKTMVRIGDLSVVDSGEFLSSLEETTWEAYPGTPQKYHYISIKKTDGSDISDQWLPFEYYIPHYIDVSQNLSGEFHFDIYSDFEFMGFNRVKYTNSTYRNNFLRIRKLAVTLVDIDSLEEVGDQDKEFIGYLDQTVREEAEKVDLICGTDQTCIDRGKIMKYLSSVYSPITAWTRDAQTYKIEELLLNSLSSNYRFGYLTLSNLKLKNSFNQLNVLTDDDFISSKNMMVKSMRINFRDNLIEATITEVTPDELTIVPS